MQSYVTTIDETVTAKETYIHAIHYQFNDASGVLLGIVHVLLERDASFIMPETGYEITLGNNGKKFVGRVSKIVLDIQIDTTGPNVGNQAYIVCNNSNVS